jgi:peptide/nickel transport system substrate-binding protein
LRDGPFGCVLALSVLAAALACCGAASGAARSVGVGDGRRAGLPTLNLRLTGDWSTFDLQVDMRNSVVPVVTPLYDRLLGWSKDYSNVVPYLATSWKQTSKSITFNLRRDAKCTDGHVLNAVDILNSFKRLIQVPKRAGSIVTSSIGGWGPGPYHLHANVAKATFSLSLDSPWREKLSLFANMPVICPAGLAAVSADPHALETAAYGSGPYTLVSATHGDQIVYKLRPDWSWGPPGTSAKTMPDTLVYKVVTNDTTAANLLLTGGLDIAVINGSDIGRLLDDGSLAHKEQAVYTPHTLLFNMRAGRPFADDEKLREAIMTAVDPQAWNVAALDSRGARATSIFRKGAECYSAKAARLLPTPSLDRAKQLLASDGWTLSGGKLTKEGQALRLNLLTATTMQNGPEYLLNVLNNLGIDVTLNNGPTSQYGVSFLSGNFDIMVLRASTSIPFPGPGYANEVGAPTPAGTNAAFTGGGDPLYTRLTNAANQNLANCKYWEIVQDLVVQKHYLLPLADWNFDIFARKNIDFPSVSPDLAFPIYYVKAK